MIYHLVDLYQYCSIFGPGVKKWPHPGGHGFPYICIWWKLKKSSSPKPKGEGLRYLVWSIVYRTTIKIVQTLALGSKLATPRVHRLRFSIFVYNGRMCNIWQVSDSGPFGPLVYFQSYRNEILTMSTVLKAIFFPQMTFTWHILK